jgi:hypothetical protein
MIPDVLLLGLGQVWIVKSSLWVRVAAWLSGALLPARVLGLLPGAAGTAPDASGSGDYRCHCTVERDTRIAHVVTDIPKERDPERGAGCP